MNNFNNVRQVYAYEKKLKDKILLLYPTIKDESGIYIFTREENGFKYAYVGQAIKLLSRLAGHLRGYQHIDLSLKKHGLYTEQNKDGWKIKIKYCNDLDAEEQAYIKLCADKGYQLYNHTTGSQGKGKAGLKENVRKGYQQGVEHGYKKAQALVSNLFEKHLNYEVKNAGNKNQEKAKEKFEEFIKR
jgi:hypothetical protein